MIKEDKEENYQGLDENNSNQSKNLTKIQISGYVLILVFIAIIFLLCIIFSSLLISILAILIALIIIILDTNLKKKESLKNSFNTKNKENVE